MGDFVGLPIPINSVIRNPNLSERQLMFATDLQSTLALFGGVTDSRAESISLRLRAANLLPKGGRGLSAPSLSPIEAARLMIAAAATPTVEMAVETVLAVAALAHSQHGQFGEYLAHLLGDDDAARSVRHIRILPRSGLVEITMKDDELIRFFDPAHAEPPSLGQGYVGQIGHIGVGALRAVAVELAETEEEAQGEQVG